MKSDSETVSVLAGTFDNCLLIEQVTSESDSADDAPEQEKRLNQDIFCGTCRAWYAPGVGLIRLHVCKQGGAEGVMELSEYSIKEQSGSYLPLAIGNRWVYGWPDLPSDWVAKESYEVTASHDSTWFVQRYGYAYKTDESSG